MTRISRSRYVCPRTDRTDVASSAPGRNELMITVTRSPPVVPAGTPVVSRSNGLASSAGGASWIGAASPRISSLKVSVQACSSDDGSTAGFARSIRSMSDCCGSSESLGSTRLRSSTRRRSTSRWPRRNACWGPTLREPRDAALSSTSSASSSSSSSAGATPIAWARAMDHRDCWSPSVASRRRAIRSRWDWESVRRAMSETMKAFTRMRWISAATTGRSDRSFVMFLLGSGGARPRRVGLIVTEPRPRAEHPG